MDSAKKPPPMDEDLHPPLSLDFLYCPTNTAAPSATPDEEEEDSVPAGEIPPPSMPAVNGGESITTTGDNEKKRKLSTDEFEASQSSACSISSHSVKKRGEPNPRLSTHHQNQKQDGAHDLDLSSSPPLPLPTSNANVVAQNDASSQCDTIGSECVVDYSSEFTTNEIFKSREALVHWAREIGKRHGFVVVVKTSDNGGYGKMPRITLGCERSGYYRDKRKGKELHKEKRVKMASTKKCGCPFALKGRKLVTDNDWTVHVVCGGHNHPATEHCEGHSYAGRLSEEETSLLVDMSKSMVRPREILVTLKQRDALNATKMKTIYNARHRFKVAKKAGTSELQQLLGQLAADKYIEWHRSCENVETVTDLLWAHPVSLDLLRAFPRILIMDCTNKTNRFHLPLLEIVGVTSNDMTFSVAFAYLQHEQEDNYTWALDILRSQMDESLLPEIIVTDGELPLMNAISRVFPSARHLLCRSHINKNVMAKCKNLFETEEKWDKFIMNWNLLVMSSSEEEYNKQLAALNKEFITYPEALNYVTSSWLDGYKDKFVAAWTDTCMHCGNVTTNKAESSHEKLKRHLGSIHGTFESFWMKLHNLLEMQHTNIKSSFEKSLTILQHKFEPSEFKELRGNISMTALDGVLAETKRANSVGCDVVACGCAIRRTHGLPCAHEIADYMREGGPIPLDSIHPHWRKLDMLAASKSAPMELDCKAELELIAQRFNEYDSIGKLAILKKLRELVMPNSTFSVESEVKVDTSTRCEPVAFELVASGQDSYSPLVTTTLETTGASLQAKSKRRMKEKVYRTRSLKPLSYRDEFPVALRPYIQHVKDVAANVNCGFRAIAGLMGFGEDGWVQVKKDLLKELHSHADYYKQLYGSHKRFDELTNSLEYFEDSTGYDRWMTMPDMGHLISSYYNVVLYHLSSQQCLTFLPLRSVPMPTASRREIAIGFVNGNHFVQVFLLAGHPVPPIATKWFQYHHASASGWDVAYNARIQHFRDVAGDKAKLKARTDHLRELRQLVGLE